MRTYNLKTYDNNTHHYVLKVKDLDETQAIHITKLLEKQGYSVLVESYESLRETINHELPHHSEEYITFKHALHVFYVRIKVKLFKLIRRLK